MKNLTRSLVVMIALTLLSAGAVMASSNGDSAKTGQACDKESRTQIEAVLSAYEKALNASDTNTIMTLYTDDGVFMPSSKPTASGQKQIRAAYNHVFEQLDLNVSFNIDEIEKRDDIAFVRTTSDGKITLLKQSRALDNSSRELFIMKRIGDAWKIYRYMFNEVTAQ